MLLIKSGGVDPSPSPLDHAVKALSKRGVLVVSHTIDELKHSSANGPISKGREIKREWRDVRAERERQTEREGGETWVGGKLRRNVWAGL